MTAKLPIQLINTAQSLAGQVLSSTGPNSAPVWVGPSIAANYVSVEDPQFGASPGATDNWAAIQAAVTYCLANGVALRVPRKYSLSQKITGSGSLMIFGAGMDVSELSWPANATSFGIEITLSVKSNGLSATSGLQDICLTTGAAAQGVAAKFIGATAGASDRITPRVNINRVAVRGTTGPLSTGFDTGLFFDNCTGVVVDQFNFWGKVNSAGEPNYDSSYGIRYDNTVNASPHPTEFSFSHCRIYYAKTLIYGNDFEGGYVHHNQLVGGNAGVRLMTPGPGFPHAIVADNHINASDFGVVVGGMYEVQIHDNLIYKQLGTGTGVGVNVSAGSQFCNIHDNTFECYATSVSMNAIVIDTASNNLVHGNIFRRSDSVDGTAHGVGVWLTPNSSNNRVVSHDQIYNATTTATVLNQGTGNTVVA